MMKSKKCETINLQHEIDKIANGDINSIINGIYSDNSLVVLNSILFGVKYKCIEEKFILKLNEQAKNSEMRFFGNPVSKFALAALDILGEKKYTGKDEFVLSVINNGGFGV